MKTLPRFLLFLLLSAALFSCGSLNKTPTTVKMVKVGTGSLSDKEIVDYLTAKLVKLGFDEGDLTITVDGDTVLLVVADGNSYRGGMREDFRRGISEPHLEFWETYSVSEAIPLITAALKTPVNGDTTALIAAFTSILEFDPNMPGSACTLGFVNVNDTAKMNQTLAGLQATGKLPGDLLFRWSQDGPSMGMNKRAIVMLKAGDNGRARFKNPVVSAAAMKEVGGAYQVDFILQGFDAIMWKNMTKENTGRSVAMVFDGSVVWWPTVQGEISRGQCSLLIPEKEDAETITTALNNNPLPFRLRIIEETGVIPKG